MSANVYWEPVKRGRSLKLNAPSKFVEAMNSRFGASPWNLHTGDLSFLNGLAWAQLGDIEELIEAIDKYGGIRVWPEY